MASLLSLIATPAWQINAPPLSQRALVRVNSVSAVMSTEDAAKQAWLAKNKPAWSPPGGFSSSGVAMTESSTYVAPVLGTSTTEEDAKQAWLARNKPTWRSPSAFSSSDAQPSHINVDEAACPPFVHAPLGFFAPELLTPKGTRRAGGSLVDVGEPEDFSRPLWKSGDGASVGSWACTQGGWDSPKLRPTTEIFLVLDGEGSVTDVGGPRQRLSGATAHHPGRLGRRQGFGPGLLHALGRRRRRLRRPCPIRPCPIRNVWRHRLCRQRRSFRAVFISSPNLLQISSNL